MEVAVVAPPARAGIIRVAGPTPDRAPPTPRAIAPSVAPAPAAAPPPDLVDLRGGDGLLQGRPGQRERGRRAQGHREHRGAGEGGDRITSKAFHDRYSCLRAVRTNVRRSRPSRSSTLADIGSPCCS